VGWCDPALLPLPPHLLPPTQTWREYENIHILFWLGKDVAWINLIPAMWIVFLVPTAGIAWDMVYVTFWRKHLMVRVCVLVHCPFSCPRLSHALCTLTRAHRWTPRTTWPC